MSSTPAHRHSSEPYRHIPETLRSRSRPPENRLARVLRQAMAGVLLGSGAAMAAHAQPAAETAEATAGSVRRYDIPAGPLSEAVNQLAAASRVYLTGSGALTAGKTTPGLHGTYTVSEAFSALLASTGLEAVRTGDGQYALRQAAAGTVPTLAPLRVVGSDETATGVLEGYIARRAITATKTDTPIAETPQSVSVVVRDQIVDQGANNLREALQYTPGIVGTETGDVPTFAIRGFNAYGDTGSFYLDGTKYATNMYQGQPELYGLERIELLRGPASILYGTSSPGGVINMVSKRPTLIPLHQLNVEYGGFDRKTVSGDFGGRLTDDGAWSYRLTGLMQDSDTSVQHVPDDRTFLAPALTWAPSDDTSLTLLASYRKTRTRYLYGLPSAGTLEATASGKIPRRRFIGDPDHDRYDEEAYSAGYLLKHRLSGRVQFSQTLRYEKSRTNLDYATYRSYADAAGSVINRGFSARTIDAHALALDSNATIDWGTDAFANKTLVGFDYVKQHQDDGRWNYDISPLDVYDPGYGVSLTRYRTSVAAQKLFKENMGVYLQNQARISERWVALLGGRYDWARIGNSPYSGEEDWTIEKSEKFTGRVGFVYLADNGLAPYASFSQSFEPASGVDRNGRQFKPTEGEQYEVGIRYPPTDSDTQVTASVYQLTQKNILTADSVDPDYSAQTGKARSRGFELEAKARLAGNLTVTAGYAYTLTKVLESRYDGEKGRQLPFTPRHQFSLWVIYDNLLGVHGLKVGGGARYVGSSKGFYYVDADVRPYTLFDAMASYAAGPWKFALNVRNVANKRYVSNCTYGCFYGEPRTVTGTVSYTW